MPNKLVLLNVKPVKTSEKAKFDYLAKKKFLTGQRVKMSNVSLRFILYVSCDAQQTFDWKGEKSSYLQANLKDKLSKNKQRWNSKHFCRKKQQFVLIWFGRLDDSALSSKGLITILSFWIYVAWAWLSLFYIVWYFSKRFSKISLTRSNISSKGQ